MAALTQARQTVQVGDHAVVGLVQIPIAAGVKIFAGAPVMMVGGYATNATAVTGGTTVGVQVRVVPNSTVAQPLPGLVPNGDADNTSGGNGAFWIEARRGTWKFANGSGADAVTQAVLPCPVYWLDNQTVSVVATGKSVAGMAWFIDVDGQVAVELGIRSATGV